MGKVYDKFLEILRGTDMVRNRRNWTAHRFMLFFFSLRGWRRMANFSFKMFRYLWRAAFGGQEVDDYVYDKWISRNTPSERDINEMKDKAGKMDQRPLISIVLPVFRPELSLLKAAVNSVFNQAYDNWQLCIADDASEDETLSEYLRELQKDDRIRVAFREENGHISRCSNTAAELAEGVFLTFLDHDDVLAPEALYRMVEAINEQPEADLFYSDEDKLDVEGRRKHPHFKPDYAPFNLLSRNYFGHLVVMSKALFDQAGKFREGYEGSQDYDLWLRAVELSKGIVHVPQVLYHWRMHEGSAAGNEGAKHYAFENGIKALEDCLRRRKINGKVSLLDNSPGIYRIHFELKSTPMVSVIIPTKDSADVLEVCLKSLFEKTDYEHFEVIVLNNNSEEKSFFDLMDHWHRKEASRFRVIDQAYPFNFSKLMNAGAEAAKGEVLLLLNNDTEVIQGDWMQEMLSHVMQERVGAVGVKLLYPNDTIQHAGVVIGIQGLAGHAFTAAERDEAGYNYYLKTTSNFSAVTAACLMVTKEAFKAVEGFDEGLAVDYNDIDFCLRLLEAGYQNLMLGHVELYHHESLTRGHPLANRKVYNRYKKEVELYKGRWKKYIENDPFYNINLTRITTHFEPRVHG